MAEKITVKVDDFVVVISPRFGSNNGSLLRSQFHCLVCSELGENHSEFFARKAAVKALESQDFGILDGSQDLMLDDTPIRSRQKAILEGDNPEKTYSCYEFFFSKRTR